MFFSPHKAGIWKRGTKKREIWRRTDPSRTETENGNGRKPTIVFVGINASVERGLYNIRGPHWRTNSSEDDQLNFAVDDPEIRSHKHLLLNNNK